MLQLKNIKKDYQTAGQTVHALRGVSLRFRANEFVSILGPSGCGKTTLLNIVGGLDHYTDGDLVICGKSTKDYKDKDWDVYRNHRIGFVFQSYNLIPHQTVLGNVELALTIAGVTKAERRRRATEALKKVGLEKELKKRPNQLSGGQMQRVAIARALVNNPEILLADEPTGALDTVTSVQIMELIREIAGERLVIMVTHNPELAEEYSSRIVRLQDGLVISDSNPYDGSEEIPVSEEELSTGAQIQTRQNLDVRCPYCGRKQTLSSAFESLESEKTVCPACQKAFLIKKSERLLKKIKTPEKAYEKEKPVPNKRAKKSSKKERSSMSFGTSLGLSARNLATKKGRTFITSFAGSIGIISVCLVLALSNGFNGYIAKTEEDMLSSYPLEITETTFDLTSVMSSMTSIKDMPDMDKLGDKVYVNSFLTNIAQGMTVTNDISPEYVAYLEAMDKELYTAIVYGTGMNISHTLFTEVELENASGDKEKKAMSISALKAYYTQKLSEQEEKYAKLAPMVDYLGSIYGKMPGTTDVNADDYGDYVLSQYELIGEKGHFPAKPNEVALVVGTNNDITDLTLAQLGLIDEDLFMSLFPVEGETNEEFGKTQTIDFDELFQKKFMLNYNNAVYTAAGADSAYLFDYAGTRSTLNTGEENGIELEITCILRLKDGLNYGCLGTGGLYFTEQLISEYQAVNMQSEIAKEIKAQTEKQNSTIKQLQTISAQINALDTAAPEYEQQLQTLQMQAYLLLAQNGKYFKPAASTLQGYYMSYPENDQIQILYGDTALRAVGGDDSPNDISIYTDTFDAKEGLLAYLDAWNDAHDKDEQIRYTDTVGMMMSMVETMLDAVTYVLVAFTAISLVVSSVMIGIITYVSVVERTKEIGVLRSLGARKKDVKNLFNAETFIIGLQSGLFGVAITYLLCIAINAILGALTGLYTLASLPIGSAIIMVCVSVALTLISGLIPAQAAAKKDPVIALRTE